jgi:tRNA-2-methylthio-N6-dimethylallyladenosine synthase
VVNETAALRYEAHVGRRVEILVEGPSKKNPERLTGRTRCNKIVVFDGAPRHMAEVMDVKITRSGSFTLYGEADVLE